MDTSIESTRPTRISVHADKLRKLWSTSSFDVGNGPHTGRNFYNLPTLTEEICPFTWEGSRLPTIKSAIRFAIATGRPEAT